MGIELTSIEGAVLKMYSMPPVGRVYAMKLKLKIVVSRTTVVFNMR
jgi:hypothetical protein